MARKFIYASVVGTYSANLKSSVKQFRELAPLIDRSKSEIQHIDVRQALRDGTLKPLSEGVLTGGGFTETEEDRKKLEEYEKKEKEKEKEEEED